MADQFTEAPPNWLSEIIHSTCEEISRWLPRRERLAERDAIVAKIKSAKEGKELAAHPHLSEIVWDGLTVYYSKQQYLREHPKILSSSPWVEASWHVFREAGLPVPGMNE